MEGEEEERRKGLVRRWMVSCKVSEYVCPMLFEGCMDNPLFESVANDIALRRNIDMMWHCCICNN